MIGVVGGVGPYAGLDLLQKIFDQTVATRDQEHLPVALLSLPARIADRTAFLQNRSTPNPGEAIGKILLDLERMGASVAGIPCNTAHAPLIYDAYIEELRRQNSSLKFVHMIEETGRFVCEQCPDSKRLGLLATLGTCESGLYPDILGRFDLEVSLPAPEFRERVHRAIYDPEYGIKARSNPVTEKATGEIVAALSHLEERGAQGFILGCTELPLAVATSGDRLLIDPTLVLARALIREFAPKKLAASLRRVAADGRLG